MQEITLNNIDYKIVQIPKEGYDIQLWNHGIGFKHDNYHGNTDSNGFYHIETGLEVWRDYQIKGILDLNDDFKFLLITKI